GSKLPCAAVRLACVRPAASVHSEPGSNSSLEVSGSDRSPRQCFECSVVPAQITLHAHLAMLVLDSFGLCRTSAMDNHPPARRPHKSPAHTVKDPWNRPQRLIPYPSPKCPSEPHIIQQISWPSTPQLPLFPAAPRRGRLLRGGPRIVHAL